jgi:selenocysteine-specific elongation factor
MLAGVGGIDAVLLVVAADESVMPQTREHFEICRLLHVPSGIVVLTKADLVDEETLELVRLEVRDLVAGSFLQDAPVIAVSSKTGTGLEALRSSILGLARESARRGRQQGAARLPIDRVFTVKGFGTVVTGTLVSGEITADVALEVLPSRRAVKTRGIQVHGRTESHAVAGQRVAVNLGGVEVTDIARGESLVEPGTLEPTRVADAAIEAVAGARPLRHGARIRFHQGTSEVLGRVALAGPVGPSGSAPFVEVPPGGRAYVRLRLESPAVLTRGDRFILRAYSPPTTIAGGLVLDPDPPRAGIRRPGSRRRFERLDPGAAGSAAEAQPAEDRAAALFVEEAGAAGLPVSAMTTRAGIAPGARAASIDRLSRANALVRAGDVLVTPAVIGGLQQQLVAAVAAYHRSEPLSEGLPREEARERLFSRAGPGVFDRVIADLVAAGTIQARDRLALASHRVSLSGDEERARAAIERLFRDAGLRPPDPASLAGLAGVGPEVADRVLKLLLRQKVLLRVDTLLFHEDSLARLRQEVAALKAAAGNRPATIDVATFKDRFGVTRKFAIPLLEYLDRERVTKRAGEVRVVI